MCGSIAEFVGAITQNGMKISYRAKSKADS
jgi:hypothetical protein